MPTSFLPKTFCGFLPLHHGVFAMSGIAMIAAAIVTITGWSQVMQLNAHPISLSDEAALFFHSILFTVLAILGLVGIILSVRPRPIPIGMYLALLALHLLVSICAGIFILVVIFRGNTPDAVRRCLHGAKDDLTKLVCNNGIAIQKPMALIVYLVSWVLETYMMLLFYSFMHHLKEPPSATMFSNNMEVAELESPSPPKFRPSHRHDGSGSNSIDINNISSPAPYTIYNSAGGAGTNHGYAFSTVESPEWGNATGRPAPRAL